MPSNYPSALDNWGDVPATQAELPTHDTQHNQLRDMVQAVQAEVGAVASSKLVRPYATKEARDAAVPTPVAGITCTVGGALQVSNGSKWLNALLDDDAVWHNLTLQNGWVNHGFGYPPASVARFGPLLLLRGTVRDGTIGANTPIAVLPDWARPDSRRATYAAEASYHGWLVLEPDGRLHQESGTAGRIILPSVIAL